MFENLEVSPYPWGCAILFSLRYVVIASDPSIISFICNHPKRWCKSLPLIEKFLNHPKNRNKSPGPTLLFFNSVWEELAWPKMPISSFSSGSLWQYSVGLTLADASFNNSVPDVP